MTRVYFDGVPASVTREDLRNFFKRAGEVRAVFLVTDKVSGKSRGFGCVEMASAHEAASVATVLKDVQINGGSIRIHSTPPPKTASD
jgi:RNA recognition motif-containing protein